MILLFHNFLHFAKLLNKKYGTHTESRILHLHKIFYSALWNNDIEAVSTKSEYNSSLPFLPSYVNSISLEDTFHYVGKKVVWCSDNKFRECKAVKFNFEYEGHPYSELFFIDKSVEEDYAILGSIFWSKCDILK